MYFAHSPYTPVEAIYGVGAILFGQKRPDSSLVVIQDHLCDRPVGKEGSFDAPGQLIKPR